MTHQRITLVGNLGDDPQMKYLNDGRAVTEFSLAVNEYTGRRRKGGKKQQSDEETVWFKITTWETLAETCAEHLFKGRKVLVEGKLRKLRPWLDRDGNPRCDLELTAREVKFLDSKDSRDGIPEEGYVEDREDAASADTSAPPYRDTDYEIEDVLEGVIPY